MNTITIIQKNNIENLCRTCMASDVELTSLFSVLSLSNKEEALNSILYKCTSIEVHNTDVLPKSICSSCLEKLAICYLYRELCYDTQVRLEQLYESQKQALPFISTQTETFSTISTIEPALHSAIVDTKVTEYVIHSIKNLEVTSATLPLTLSKPEILDQTCDIDYVGCDSQNSYLESPEEVTLDNLGHENLEFICNVCSKKCSGKYALKRHMKTHQDAEELKCHICLKLFSRAADVKRHLTSHTGEKPYQCRFCGSSFAQSGSLTAHIRQKHPNTKFNNQYDQTSADQNKIQTNPNFQLDTQCEQAIVDENKAQTGPANLDNRYEQTLVGQNKSPPKEKSYLCPSCGKFFRHAASLKIHLRRHTGDKPYECQICKNRFVSSGRLKSHLRAHTGERPFTCGICYKTFAHSSGLHRHRKNHADIKPYKCSYCEKRFLVPYDLNIHIRQHTGEKPLSCPICARNFSCPKILKQHEKIHSNHKPYICTDCGKQFRRPQHLRVHAKLHGK